MKTIKTSLALTFLVMAAACAHHRDVRPGEDVHRVVTKGEEKDQAEQDAIRQANHFCEQYKKHAVFVEEKTNYQGSMDEDTRKNVRNASKAAAVVGSGMGVFGGRNERNAGGVVGGAGVVGGIMTGDDAYVSEMKFKCK